MFGVESNGLRAKATEEKKILKYLAFNVLLAGLKILFKQLPTKKRVQDASLGAEKQCLVLLAHQKRRFL